MVINMGASFTIRLKDALDIVGCEISLGEDNISRITNGANIGFGDYPIFDTGHRDLLTGMIIDHFYNREIGQETIELFKLSARRKMNEIMPYFNKLFESTQLVFDPLKTVNLSTNSNTVSNQTNTNEATATSNAANQSASRTVNSETPQVPLSGNASYATSAADANAQGTGSNESNENSTQNAEGTNEVDTTVSGYQAAPSDLLMRYRESIINVDLMVINELEDLFMLVWDNADAYTKGYTL